MERGHRETSVKAVEISDIFDVVRTDIRPWEKIVIHHSGGRSYPLKKGKLYGRIFDRYHRSVKMWRHGLGYHFVVNPGGEIETGKRWIYQGLGDVYGAHCIGYNTVAIGICVAGNFNAYKPTEEQLAVLLPLVDHLCHHFGLDASDVYGHCELNRTDCPGKNLSMDFLRHDIKLRLEFDENKEAIRREIRKIQTAVNDMARSVLDTLESM